jgi:hypothetical protein
MSGRMRLAMYTDWRYPEAVRRANQERVEVSVKMNGGLRTGDVVYSGDRVRWFDSGDGGDLRSDKSSSTLMIYSSVDVGKRLEHGATCRASGVKCGFEASGDIPDRKIGRHIHIFSHLRKPGGAGAYQAKTRISDSPSLK